MNAFTPVRIPRNQELVPGTLVRRYARFLADVDLDSGGRVVSHCVNTGSMEGLTRPGTRIWLSRSDNPNRKLKFTWEVTELHGEMVGTNTALPNKIVRHLLENRLLPWMPDWDELKPEHPYGERSRVDFFMRYGDRKLYLEVKNLHLAYPDRRGYFPDSVSERAAHHMMELAATINTRTRAHVMFACQAPGVKAIRPSDAHDRVFAQAAREAAKAGVRFSAIAIRHEPDEIIVERRLPVDLKPYPTERIVAWRKQNTNR